MADDAVTKALEAAAQEGRNECGHPKVMPAYDAEAVAARRAAGLHMSPGEVKRRYPRFYGTCPDCGWRGILYASYEHYIMGDW